MTVGWPLSSGLLRPAQVIFGNVLKNKEMFLLCQGWSHLVLGEPEDILSGHAWTVYTVLKTVSVSTTYSAQSRKCPATSQPRFTAGFSALPTAASVLSAYPSGTRLDLRQQGVLKAVCYGWFPVPNGNPVTGPQITSLYGVSNPTQKLWKDAGT